MRATSEFRAVRFPSADGSVELFARDYAGSGPCIVMMHGLTRNSADFADLAARLAGRFRVIVPDQRGRGLSDWDPDPTHYSPAIYCADMTAMMARLGLDRPVLIGTSMGGLMAMIMGATANDAYRGIVLNDVGPEVDGTGLARIANYVGLNSEVADWDEAAAYCRATNGPAFPNYDEADWQAFARRLFTQDDDGVPRLAYDLAIAAGVTGPGQSAVPPDLWPVWDALSTIPVLAIRGELSDILSVETLAEMDRRHPGMRSVTVPGVGHAPMLNEPEAVEGIERFLASISECES